jgi:hypothetical protein
MKLSNKCKISFEGIPQSVLSQSDNLVIFESVSKLTIKLQMLF